MVRALISPEFINVVIEFIIICVPEIFIQMSLVSCIGKVESLLERLFEVVVSWDIFSTSIFACILKLSQDSLIIVHECVLLTNEDWIIKFILIVSK